MLGIALALGSLLTTGTTAALLAGASMVVGVYTAREQRRKAQRALERSVKDRTVMVREAVTDRPYAFGRVRMSGQIQFPGTHGPASEYLNWCLALTDEIDAVEQVWFDDASIGTLDADGWTTTGSQYFSAPSVPALEYITVTSGATVTLAHTASAIQSISGWLGGSGDELEVLYGGTPATDRLAYSTQVVGGVTVITVHAANIGRQLTVSYTWARSEPLARAKAFLGSAGQTADPYLITNLGAAWSASDKFANTSYLSGTLRYNPDVYPNGIPNISAVVRGAKCYDPRTGTHVWTRNPALIAWKWISLRYPDETVDAAALIAAANVCDEQVEYLPGQYHARYTFDDVISSDTSTVDGLERVLQAMVGSAVRACGVWMIWAGAWEAPTIDLDESDLAPGEITVQGIAEDGVLFNGVSGRYMDPTRWVEDPFPAYVSPTYVAADNGETEVLDLDLTQIADVYRAQRVARLLLHKARQALTFACTLEMSAFSVGAGAMVRWTIPRYGWANKAFRCLKRVYQPATGTIQAVFQEDAEAIYASSYSELTTPDPAPNTDLPNPLVVAAPIITTASGAVFCTLSSDGSQRPFMRVYWQQYDESVESVEIWWRRAEQTTWQQASAPASTQAFDAYGVSSGETWIVQARAVNGVGVRSPWSVQRADIDTSAPANFVGPGMIGTPEIQASAATDVYQYNYAGPAIAIEHASGAGSGGTELIDRVLIRNDLDDAVQIILTARAEYTVTGKGLGSYFAIDQQFGSNEVLIDLDVPPWNWIDAATQLVWPLIDTSSERTVTQQMMVSTKFALAAGDAVGLTLAARVSDAYISGVVFTSAYAANPSLRVEVIKR